MVTDQVREALAEGPWSRRQQSIVAFAALAIVFDGFDNQALGLSIASISRSWNIPTSAFGSVAAVGLIGMTIGTWLAGMIGDRFGRRRALIGSVAVFGIFTMLTALADGILPLVALRFCAGLGLGGAMPNATAIAAEFSPLRSRPLAITLTIVCVPLGGLLGGVIAAELLPTRGWQALFLIGGFAPLVLAAALIAFLPETPSYLARFPGRRDELQQVLKQIGHDIELAPGEDSDLSTDRDEQAHGFRSLFEPEYRRSTIGLWMAFFLCLIAVYTTFNWVPATLSSAGFSARTSSLALAGFNFGGIAGAILGGLLIGPFGYRRVILPLGGIGVVVAGAVAASAPGAMSDQAILVALSVLGFSVNGVQTTLFALAAQVYRSEVRATGVGAALGFGRVGAILSTFLGAAIAGSGSTSGVFLLLAGSMAGAMAGLALVRDSPPVRE